MKKTIPLAIRRVLEELSQDRRDLFIIEFEKGSVITFKDIDSISTFRFQLETINVTNSKTSYVINYNPSNEENLNPIRTGAELNQIKGHFEKWLSLLSEINKESPLFDDPITQSYYDELEPSFDIIDKDANYKTFSINQQKLIVHFLNAAHTIIEEQNNMDIEGEEVINLITETKKSLSKTTKKKVIKCIRLIIAKGFKIGLEIGEKLLIEFTTELTKKLLIGNQ
jgi:hypothetical protein